MKILIHVKQIKVESTLTFILNDILNLNKKADIKILCSESSLPPSILEENVIYYPFDVKGIKQKVQHFLAIHDIKIYFKNNVLIKVFSEAIQNFKPDLIITHFGDESLIFLQNASFDVPVLVFFHGYDASAWLNVKKYIKVYKDLIRTCNLIPVTCSENMEQRMQDAGIPMQKSILLYYGIDTAFFKRVNYKRNTIPNFLQVSSFHEKKGHSFTVRAFRKYLDRNPDSKFRIIFAGEGVLKKNIEHLVKQLKMEDYISFRGWVNRKETKQLLENAEYFVHHSITDKFGNMEGIPNAIIEAMAMELPLITTYHSGIPELVSNSKNGILVPEKNIDEFSQAIEKILNYKYLEDNRLKVEKQFKIDNRIEKLFFHIQRILNEEY